MKILCISNLYPPHGIGGYEVRCQQTLNCLAARGHEVQVLTSVHGSGHQVETQGPIKVMRELRINGFFGHPWQPIHRLHFLERHNQKALLQALRTFSPDIVHVWNMGGLSKALLTRLESLGVPIAYDVSDHWIARSLKADVWMSWWNAPGSPGRNLARTLITLTGLRKGIDRWVPTASGSQLRFENVYFCSEFLKRLTAKAGYAVQHGEVIYCGVQAERFIQKEHWKPPQKLLWVGRLAEDKDPLTAVRGLAEASNTNLTLDLYGKGDESFVNRIREAVSALNLGNRVQIRHASHEAMSGIYAQYDALLFTSNWGEPFALTPLEAMAARLPVIMCPDGGDAELARDGQNCLMFEAASPTSLAQAIDRLCRTADFGQSLSETALQELQQRYTVTVMVDRIEAFLKSCLARPQTP